MTTPTSPPLPQSRSALRRAALDILLDIARAAPSPHSHHARFRDISRKAAFDILRATARSSRAIPRAIEVGRPGPTSMRSPTTNSDRSKPQSPRRSNGSDKPKAHPEDSDPDPSVPSNSSDFIPDPIPHHPARTKPQCTPAAASAPATYAARSGALNVVPSTHRDNGTLAASHAGPGVSCSNSTAHPIPAAAITALDTAIRGHENTTSQYTSAHHSPTPAYLATGAGRLPDRTATPATSVADAIAAANPLSLHPDDLSACGLMPELPMEPIAQAIEAQPTLAPLQRGEVSGGPIESKPTDGEGGCSTSSLPSLRPIENHPDNQVLRKLLESMHNPGRHKQKIPRPEPLPRRPIDEPPAPTHDDVHLIPSVGSLRINPARVVDLNRQRPMPEHLNKPSPTHPGQPAHRLPNTHPPTPELLAAHTDTS